jgi:hypothetical protein
MSLHLITIDELMQLDMKTLEFALRVFRQELDAQLRRLQGDEPSWTNEQTLEELSSILTLRKVFLERLLELGEERRQRPALPASQQYEHNQRQPLAA